MQCECLSKKINGQFSPRGAVVYTPRGTVVYSTLSKFLSQNKFSGLFRMLWNICRETHLLRCLTEFLMRLWNTSKLIFLRVFSNVCAQTTTAENTVISPNFLVWTFCGKAQFLHSFGRFARNYLETVPFHKISVPGN